MSENKQNDNIQNDFDKTRDTLYDLLEQGQEGLATMLEVLKETEHPRAGEVFTTMLKNNADIAEKILSLNKKMKEIRQLDVVEKPSLENGKTNNIFIGSSTELQRMLSGDVVQEPIDVTPNDSI
jgi:hypothetical protein